MNDQIHYSDVTMSTMAPQSTTVSIVYSIICSGTHLDQSSASLAFVRGIHWWPVDSPHRGLVMQKMLPFDDVIMSKSQSLWYYMSSIIHFGKKNVWKLYPEIWHACDSSHACQIPGNNSHTFFSLSVYVQYILNLWNPVSFKCSEATLSQDTMWESIRLNLPL